MVTLAAIEVTSEETRDEVIREMRQERKERKSTENRKKRKKIERREKRRVSREDSVATIRSRSPSARDERYGEITPKRVYGLPDSRVPEPPPSSGNSGDPIQRAVDSQESHPTETSTHQHASIPQNQPEFSHQGTEWDLTSEELQRLKATVNERLNQARIFLSDEDVSLSLDFEEPLGQIDYYIRNLADDEIECDVGVYNEVYDLLSVHQLRMKKLRNRRLSLGEIDDGSKGDDRSSFTVERPPDLALFLQALHGNTSRGRTLRKVESEGRQEVLRDPSLVDDVLEGRASLNQSERFETRARKRGRRRAAIEIALRSFATNDEEHYEGGWQHNSLRLPSKPLVRRPESVLTIGTGKESKGHYTPPYRWTKRYLAYLKHQKSAPLSKAKERTLQQLAQSLSPTKPVFSEDRALELIEAAMLKELHENRAPRNVKYSHDWSLVAKSPGLDKRIHYFGPGRWRSTLKEPATSAKKRNAEEALANEPTRTRKNSAVAYKPLGSPSDPLSRRLPAEELGFKVYEEDSRERTPEIGTGSLMPPEMKEFDFHRDGLVLEKAPDRKEKHYPGAASFMFGETGYLSALMSREIAMGQQRLYHARNRNWTLEVEHEPDSIKDPPSPPPSIVLQSEKFALPPLERGQKYQGRFAPPPGSVNQNLFLLPTPPSPTKPLAVAPAPSFPSSSVSGPSRSSQNRPYPPKIPQPARESSDGPAASDNTAPARLKPKSPRRSPRLPRLPQLRPNRPTLAAPVLPRLYPDPPTPPTPRFPQRPWDPPNPSSPSYPPPRPDSPTPRGSLSPQIPKNPLKFPVPLLPAPRPDPSNSPAFSKLRLEYGLSPTGNLSPLQRAPEQALPYLGANFKTRRESGELGSGDSEDSEDFDEAGRNEEVEAEQELQLE